jgi:hypothetical protein
MTKAGWAEAHPARRQATALAAESHSIREAWDELAAIVVARYEQQRPRRRPGLVRRSAAVDEFENAAFAGVGKSSGRSV